MLRLQLTSFTMWARSSESAARELLGHTARAEIVDGSASMWRVEDPLQPDEPLGPFRSLVTFSADRAVEVEVVPGSQGQPAPPDGVDDAVAAVQVTRGCVLVLDGRCWYRAREPSSLRIELWGSRPKAVIL